MKLIYFAWLRSRIGTAEEQVAKPAGVATVADLLGWLESRGANYADALANRTVIRVAVNQDYVGPDHPIADGDEVALFPPVTGG